MKILKEGKLNTAIFKCKKCGTEFEADEKEIYSETYIQTKIFHQNIADGMGVYHCPVCGELVYALTPWVDHWNFGNGDGSFPTRIRGDHDFKSI